MSKRPLIAVYMEASRPFGVIYTGVTSNLFERAFQHREGKGSAFAAQRGCNMLVWYQPFAWVTDAIQREKSLKRWNRAWKMQLIEHENPDWFDLYPTLCGIKADPRGDRQASDVQRWLKMIDEGHTPLPPSLSSGSTRGSDVGLSVLSGKS